MGIEKEKRISGLQEEIDYLIKEKNARVSELERQYRQTMGNYELNIKEMRENHIYNKNELESRINEYSTKIRELTNAN